MTEVSISPLRILVKTQLSTASLTVSGLFTARALPGLVKSEKQGAKKCGKQPISSPILLTLEVWV